MPIRVLTVLLKRRGHVHHPGGSPQDGPQDAITHRNVDFLTKWHSYEQSPQHRPQAQQSKAKHSKASPGAIPPAGPKHSKARLSKAKLAKQSKAKQSKAKQSKAQQS